MKQFVLFVLFVAAILGLCYLISENTNIFGGLGVKQVNIRMPTP